jgi:hypothetical protein
MVVVRSVASTGDWITDYERFDASGAVEVPWIRIHAGPLAVAGLGVAPSGHVLVVAGSPGSFENRDNRQARWLDRDGSALTDWFALPESPDFLDFDFLVDGTLVVRDAGSIDVRYRARFEDGKAAPTSLPDWLLQRSANRLDRIRSGKGYASWGPAGPCGGQLEIIAPSGASCGCIPIPRLGFFTAIGRDGSLLVASTELQSSGPGICKYHIYPQLFR